MDDAPTHDELPLPDYDQLPLGVLSTHITGLDEAGLNQLIGYERAHGNRLPVLQVLERRLERVQEGAAPTDVSAQTPEAAQGRTGSPVSPETSGPPVNPPSHGTPFNPAQPR